MVEIYDVNYKNFPDDSEVIAKVDYVTNLDYLVNTDYENGGTGRHLGFGQLKNGDYYLVVGSNWQGERNYGYIVTARRIVVEAIKSGNINELKDYPDLVEIYETEFDENKKLLTSRVFSVRIKIKDSQGEIDKKINSMKEKIRKFINFED